MRAGDGDDFCLGGDVHDWPGIPSAELRPRVEIYAKAIDLLESLPKPTVAVVQVLPGCLGHEGLTDRTTLGGGVAFQKRRPSVLSDIRASRP